jgi:hypothetical protein
MALLCHGANDPRIGARYMHDSAWRAMRLAIASAALLLGAPMRMPCSSWRSHSTAGSVFRDYLGGVLVAGLLWRVFYVGFASKCQKQTGHWMAFDSNSTLA